MFTSIFSKDNNFLKKKRCLVVKKHFSCDEHQRTTSLMRKRKPQQTKYNYIENNYYKNFPKQSKPVGKSTDIIIKSFHSLPWVVRFTTHFTETDTKHFIADIKKSESTRAPLNRSVLH